MAKTFTCLLNLVMRCFEDPVQYSRLISFTPSANKPGELCRIRMLGIEIASYLSKHNSRYSKADSLKMELQTAHSTNRAAKLLSCSMRNKVLFPQYK
jgi:hypothetical protein